MKKYHIATALIFLFGLAFIENSCEDAMHGEIISACIAFLLWTICMMVTTFRVLSVFFKPMSEKLEEIYVDEQKDAWKILCHDHFHVSRPAPALHTAPDDYHEFSGKE